MRIFNPVPLLTGSHLDRFMAKIGPLGANGCAMWTSAVNSRGYGVFQYQCKTLHATRLLMKLTFPEWTDLSLVVMHSCDNPGCMYLDHLSLGSDMDNTTDMISKGRKATFPGDLNPARIHIAKMPRGDQHYARKDPSLVPRGEVRGNVKMTGEKVKHLRQLYAAGGVSQQKLGAMFGISQTVVGDIVRRDTWNHIG